MVIRKRILYGLSMIIIILLGLCSRKYGSYLPEWVAEFAGDTLWAAMVYLGFRFLAHPASKWKAGLYALIFSYLIEISQLYQADWIIAMRNYPFGALVLGHGFLWSDLVCYTVGITIAFAIDKSVNKERIFQ